MVGSIFQTIMNVQAEGPAKTIQMGSSEYHTDGLIAGVGFDAKILSDGTYVFCLDYYRTTPRSGSMTLHGEMDAGMTYILTNSFPNKQITNDWKHNYYITQTAIWWYLDETTGSSNLPTAFKRGESDKAGLYKYVKQLVDGGIAAKSKGYVNPSISVSSSSNELTVASGSDYYLSPAVTISGKNLSKDCTLSLTSGAPQGTEIVDENMNARRTFKAGEKFYVKVPTSKVGAGENYCFDVTVESNGTIRKVYEYRPQDSSYQRIVTPFLISTVVEASTSATFRVSKEESTPVPTPKPKRTKVEIIKKDKSNDSNLAGAKLVLKDKNGNIVKNKEGKELIWLTSEKGLVINDLAFGTYTIEELEAPEGYTLSKEKVTFTLSKSHLTESITIYNSKEEIPDEPTIVEVPDTSSNTLIYTILGAGLVTLGIAFTIRHGKKQA